MRFVIRKLKALGMALAVMVFITGFSVTVNAQGAASITIFYHGVTPGEESIALAGAEFSLYRIGAYEDGRWVLQAPFDGCRVSLEDMSASGQLEAAKKIDAYAKAQQIAASTQKTDNSGYAVFTGLEDGLYLIAPGEDISSHGGVFHSAPFLACIPEIDENGNPVYNITVEPKNEWANGEIPEEPQQPTKPEPESPQKGENVKTGDDTPVMFFAGVLVISLAAILFLLFWKKHRDNIHKESEED